MSVNASLVLSTHKYDDTKKQIMDEMQYISDVSPKSTRAQQLDLVYKQLWYLEQKDLDSKIIETDCLGDLDETKNDDVPNDFVPNGILPNRSIRVGFVLFHSTRDTIAATFVVVDQTKTILGLVTSSFCVANTMTSLTKSSQTTTPAPTISNHQVTSSSKIKFQTIELLDQLMIKFKKNHKSCWPHLIGLRQDDSTFVITENLCLAAYVGVLFNIPSFEISKLVTPFGRVESESQNPSTADSVTQHRQQFVPRHRITLTTLAKCMFKYNISLLETVAERTANAYQHA